MTRIPNQFHISYSNDSGFHSSGRIRVMSEAKRKTLRYSCAGITLIEVLVVLFILTVVSTFVFIDFRASQRRFALQNAAQQLALDIRRAQAFSLQAKEVEGLIRARYGIFIINTDRASYKLFGDIDGGVAGQYDAGEEIETINLPQNARFVSPFVANLYDAAGISCFGLVTNPSVVQVHITFTPPDPTTIIRKPSSPPVNCYKACIFLESPGTVGQKIVGVTKTGLVNIYNDIDNCIND